MVTCCVVGCTNKPDKDSPLRCYHIPRIQSKHGEDSLILSTERRKKWFSASKSSDKCKCVAPHCLQCRLSFRETYLKHQYISLSQDELNNISTELCKLKLEVRMNKVGTKDWFNS